MAVSTITSVVLLLCIFGLVISTLGYMSFSNAFKREYATSTFHIADTAAALVNGDHLEAYLAGEETAEYEDSRAKLDFFCRQMGLSLIYVIRVDTTDYGRFVSIFNLVDNSVDNTSYVPWELGFRRDTTNEEYREKYRAVYEGRSDFETVYRINLANGRHPHVTTIVPVKSSAGEVKSLLCVERPVRELDKGRRPYLINIVISTVLMAIAAAFSAAFYLKKQVVNPVRRVSEEAARFARESTRGEGLGEISRYREITSLAASIDTMESEMTRYIENLTSITAEKERIVTELTLAQQIQEGTLPGAFPAFPDRQEFDIWATMTPAREVGGDFYNYFLIDDDHLGLAIGDVSGKGIPAALFMMVTNILVSEYAKGGSSPADVLALVNKRICEHNVAEMFVTVWLGILEISTGKLTAVNAGHEYPVLKQDGRYALIKDRHGFVIGGMEDVSYREYVLQLHPGDCLFVYSDGIPEATDAHQQLFGTERMVTALNENPDASPEETLKNVRRAVDAFVQEAEQFDDMTMLCLLYRGPGRKN